MNLPILFLEFYNFTYQRHKQNIFWLISQEVLNGQIKLMKIYLDHTAQ